MSRSANRGHLSKQAILSGLGFEKFVRSFDHFRASGEVRGNFERRAMRHFRIELAATRGAAGACS